MPLIFNYYGAIGTGDWVWNILCNTKKRNQFWNFLRGRSPPKFKIKEERRLLLLENRIFFFILININFMTVFNIESVRPVSFCLFLSRSLSFLITSTNIYPFISLSVIAHNPFRYWYNHIHYIYIFYYIYQSGMIRLSALGGSLTSENIFFFNQAKFFPSRNLLISIPWWLKYDWVVPFISFF